MSGFQARRLTNLHSFVRTQFETGRQSLLQFLWQSEERPKTGRRLGLSAPKFRPLSESGVSDLLLLGCWQTVLLERVEQAGTEKSEHEARRKIAGHLTRLDLEVVEPSPHAVLGRVELWVRCFVQRLEKSGAARPPRPASEPDEKDIWNNLEPGSEARAIVRITHAGAANSADAARDLRAGFPFGRLVPRDARFSLRIGVTDQGGVLRFLGRTRAKTPGNRKNKRGR